MVETDGNSDSQLLHVVKRLTFHDVCTVAHLDNTRLDTTALM